MGANIDMNMRVGGGPAKREGINGCSGGRHVGCGRVRGVMTRRQALAILGVGVAAALGGCAHGDIDAGASAGVESETFVITDSSAEMSAAVTQAPLSSEELLAQLDLNRELYDDLAHGPKGPEYQRYLVFHDTEGGGLPEDVASYFEGNGSYVASHFIVGKDGHIVQCVPIDQIAHHAGYGDTGNNGVFGTTDESRDDMRGSSPIGSAYPDYGMNSYSIGIEIIHVGGEGDYPAEQLAALDALVAYLDAFYVEQGLENAGAIIDHKMWRASNSDTSAEFAGYLANYQDHRAHE